MDVSDQGVTLVGLLELFSGWWLAYGAVLALVVVTRLSGGLLRGAVRYFRGS